MNLFKNRQILILLFFFSVNISFVKAQNYIQISSNETAIFTESNLSSDMVIQANKGEIFKLESYNQEWVTIKMFSGELRYLKKEVVNFIFELPDEFNKLSLKPKHCEEIESIRIEAEQQAISIWGNNLEKRVEYEKFLFDKYMLNIFRKYNIKTINNLPFVWCINDSLRGPIEL